MPFCSLAYEVLVRSVHEVDGSFPDILKGLWKQLQGVFLHKLPKNPSFSFSQSFQFSVIGPFPVQNISIEGFQVKDKKKNIFSPQTESWGKSSEFTIKFNQVEKNLGMCPV